MNIKDIKVYCISTPLQEPFLFSQGWVHQRSSVIVEVITQNGVSGWGESLCHGLQSPRLAATFIEDCYRPMLLGRNVYDVEVLFEEMYNRTRPFGQAGIAINALSGLDIAIWDAKGRLQGQPVSVLLGGRFRDKVRPYATGFYRIKGGKYPDLAIKEAAMHISKGFRACKLKVGFGVQEDIAYIKAVRDSVNSDIALMADFNGAYNQSHARRIIKSLESEQIYFYEELLAPEDMGGYIALRNTTASYLAAGENIFGKIAYKDWIQSRALDILQPDICSCGGFTDCKKIATIAQAYNTMLIPHVWGSAIGLAASLQFIANIAPSPLSATPIEPMLEYDQSSHPFRLALTDNKFELDSDGYVTIPQTPGIGVQVNRSVLQQYLI